MGVRGDGEATIKWSVLSQSLPDSSGFVCEFVCGTEYKTKPDGIHNSQTHTLIRSLGTSPKFHTFFDS